MMTICDRARSQLDCWRKGRAATRDAERSYWLEMRCAFIADMPRCLVGGAARGVAARGAPGRRITASKKKCGPSLARLGFLL